MQVLQHPEFDLISVAFIFKQNMLSVTFL